MLIGRNYDIRSRPHVVYRYAAGKSYRFMVNCRPDFSHLHAAFEPLSGFGSGFQAASTFPSLPPSSYTSTVANCQHLFGCLNNLVAR